MRIRISGEFEADCDAVFAVISDPDFQSSLTTGAGSSASVTTVGQDVVVATVRIFSTDGLPSIAQSFVGDKLTLREEQTWHPAGADGRRTGSLTLAIDGTPLSLRGELFLEPDGSGCRQRIDADLRANVPLVGGRVEKAAAPAIQQAVGAEYDAIRARLND